jgi:hypothetical protein
MGKQSDYRRQELRNSRLRTILERLTPICGRQNYNLLPRVSATCPGEAQDPSNDGPAEEEVDDEDGAGAVVVPMMRNDRRQKVQGDDNR